MSTLLCADDTPRRRLVRAAALNGFDTVEVDDTQTTLTVSFLGHAPEWLTAAHLRIDGGRQVRNLRILQANVQRSEDDGLDDTLVITVDRPGDFSSYRLAVQALDDDGRPTGRVPADFDPRYACVAFSFKANCPSGLDCADTPACDAPERAEPAIDYLAKDYSSFRRLLFDRLALLLPGWTERHVPDVGVTLVELLAYAADQLSYEQDAVATEAYLGTARLRTSVRRHARLVDYRLHEGCNARAWLVAEVDDADITLQAADFYAVTPVPGRSDPLLRQADLPALNPAPYVGFQPLLPAGSSSVTWRQVRNRIVVYRWESAQCCLAAGATCATLLDPGSIPPPPPPPDHSDDCAVPPPSEDEDAEVRSGQWHQLRLQPCEVLVFEELLGPHTGNPADADPAHRHAVRLTAATPSWDPLTRRLLWEVQWCDEDALPFPLCLSATSDAPDCRPLADVSIAWGNVLLVDHGLDVDDDLGAVPLAGSAARCADACSDAETSDRPGRYRPRLTRPDLTFAAPLAPCTAATSGADDGCPGCGAASASATLQQDVLQALPAATLVATQQGGGGLTVWRPALDLLDAGANDPGFVIEMDDARLATLRFGDGSSGSAPAAGTSFSARYRVGNGPAGNVGAEALVQLVFRNAFPNGAGIRVRNPLAAAGGSAPEPVAEARLRAPLAARRRLERAITADDYAAIVVRDFPAQVQRAAAQQRASGAVLQVQVAIDARGSAEAGAALLCCIQAHLARYRRIGHDVRVLPARQVPLDVALHICVKPGYQRGHVQAALRRVLGSGRGGFFHVDALQLGAPVAASRLVAAAQAVDGVAGVLLQRFERLYDGPNGELAAGVLAIGPLEVARLDNDAGAPGNGRLALDLEGGR